MSSTRTPSGPAKSCKLRHAAAAAAEAVEAAQRAAAQHAAAEAAQRAAAVAAAQYAAAEAAAAEAADPAGYGRPWAGSGPADGRAYRGRPRTLSDHVGTCNAGRRAERGDVLTLRAVPCLRRGPLNARL